MSDAGTTRPTTNCHAQATYLWHVARVHSTVQPTCSHFRFSFTHAKTVRPDKSILIFGGVKCINIWACGSHVKIATVLSVCVLILSSFFVIRFRITFFSLPAIRVRPSSYCSARSTVYTAGSKQIEKNIIRSCKYFSGFSGGGGGDGVRARYSLLLFSLRFGYIYN